MNPLESVTAFPLTWPIGWPRTPNDRRGRPRYTTGYDSAIRHLLKELRLLPAQNVIVSSNVPTRRDGLPYADAATKRYDDPGVAVYFVRWKLNQPTKPLVIACDKWSTPAANIRAIGLTVEALRAITRAGASELLDRAFDGFKALPPAGSTTTVDSAGAAWWDVLGVPPTASLELARSHYRELSRRHHPDRGGDVGAMAMINRAWEQAQLALAPLVGSRGT